MSVNQLALRIWSDCWQDRSEPAKDLHGAAIKLLFGRFDSEAWRDVMLEVYEGLVTLESGKRLPVSFVIMTETTCTDHGCFVHTANNAWLDDVLLDRISRHCKMHASEQ